MEENKTKYQSIDEYISSFTEPVQKKLAELRAVLKEETPRAQEKISWYMPAFYLYENLVHFAAHAKHIVFTRGPTALRPLEASL